MKLNKNSKIFIAEDNLMYATLLQKKLYQQGYTKVFVFDNGRSLIRALNAKPDVILLDYNLGDYNGLGVLKIIKVKLPKVPVLFLSGQEQVSVAIQTLKNGATDYFKKSEEVFEKLFDRLNGKLSA